MRNETLQNLLAAAVLILLFTAYACHIVTKKNLTAINSSRLPSSPARNGARVISSGNSGLQTPLVNGGNLPLSKNQYSQSALVRGAVNPGAVSGR